MSTCPTRFLQLKTTRFLQLKTTRFLYLLIGICLVVDLVMFVTRQRYVTRYFCSYPVLQWLLYMPGTDGYAQNYQDKWVLRFAAINGWADSGFFLDIGAYHGEWYK